MSKPILMPQVGQDLEEGKLVEWRVKPGDKVAKGDIVAVVESEKASFDVEAFESGVVIELLFKEGDTTKVLAPLLYLGAEGETAAAQPPRVAAAAPVSAATAAPVVAKAAPARPGRSSPLARRLARSSGLDIAALAGSGPGGAVVKRDVESALKGLDIRGAGGASARKTSNTAVGSLHRAWLRRKGEGEPIVMIHGFGGDHNAWRVLAGAIAGLMPRPILAVDLPAHGGSAAPAANFDALVDAICATLEEEGVEAADLVGHSLGAAAAVAVADRARFQTRSLFLVAPAGLGPDINGEFVAGFCRARSAASLAPWMSMLTADPDRIGPAFVQVTAEARAKPGVAEAQGALAQALFPDGAQVFSVRKALERIEAPVRIVFGGADRIIPHRHLAGLPGTIGQHIFPGLGHMPQLEAPQAVARLLVETLRAVA